MQDTANFEVDETNLISLLSANILLMKSSLHWEHNVIQQYAVSWITSRVNASTIHMTKLSQKEVINLYRKSPSSFYTIVVS